MLCPYCRPEKEVFRWLTTIDAIIALRVSRDSEAINVFFSRFQPFTNSFFDAGEMYHSCQTKPVKLKGSCTNYRTWRTKYKSKYGKSVTVITLNLLFLNHNGYDSFLRLPDNKTIKDWNPKSSTGNRTKIWAEVNRKPTTLDQMYKQNIVTPCSVALIHE